MDCYYHGYSGGPGGGCRGCEQETDRDKAPHDNLARKGEEARLERELARDRSFRESRRG